MRIARWVFSIQGMILFAFPCATGLRAGQHPDPNLPGGQGPPLIPTEETVVFLAPGTNVGSIATDYGLTPLRSLMGSSTAFLMRASSVDEAVVAVGNLRGDSRVVGAYVNNVLTCSLAGFVPDDQFFHSNTPTQGQPGQWHLVNEWNPGIDARVQGAWNSNIVGTGVTIGIVDDCLQTTHPDLAPNVNLQDSYNFVRLLYPNQPILPDPLGYDWHGICVGGLASARGGNAIGVSGVAPYSRVAGLRAALNTPVTEEILYEAATYHSSDSSGTSIKVKNHSYGFKGAYTYPELSSLGIQQSSSAGTIHVFAATNCRLDPNIERDCGKKGWVCLPEVITVSALGIGGRFASYSNFGANVFVAAPGGDYDPWVWITTTDRRGWGNLDFDYMDWFSGTSAAAPIVSGVMALGKQVQPNLDTRFAKHLLAFTSDKVDPNDNSEESDRGWQTNAAGYHFNQNYGFGLINAGAFTQQAMQYQGTTSLATAMTGTIAVEANIPDNDLKESS